MSELSQGDLRLLDHEVAQSLLASVNLARVGYIALDRTPRVVTMMFMWNGTDVVLTAIEGTFKVAAIEARPSVAVSIDAMVAVKAAHEAGVATPHVLSIRGNATVTHLDGIIPEFVDINLRYTGPDKTRARVAEIEALGIRMVKIAVRPTWVGVLDFATRFPGRRTAKEFDASHFAV